ncbi:MAG: ATPase [Prevotella sp.]|nr:ATPase [Prevotella sp.]
MTLIADSGSTKTDWLLFDGEKAMPVDLPLFHTQGINPVVMSRESILSVLSSELIPALSRRLESMGEGAGKPITLYYYGAGCRPDQVEKMTSVFKEAFGNALIRAGEMSFNSDLLGAARALCRRSEGIACILGTGSNSCLYDGTRITENTPALGYVLGDEGSGAFLGRRLLTSLYKRMMPSSLREAFEQAYGLTLDDVMAKVYREPMPNRFLASLAPFLKEHVDDSTINNLIVSAFREFFANNVKPYGRADLPVSFVGSIAHHFSSLLHEAASEEGFTVGTILKSPISQLALFHCTEK